METGENVQMIVEEAPKLAQRPALILDHSTEEMRVQAMERKTKTAMSNLVQVHHILSVL